MRDIYEIVLQASFYGSIVAISILVLKQILKNKISPKWTYFLWIILILKLICPIGPESSFSIFNKVDIKYEQNTSLVSSNLQNNLANDDSYVDNTTTNVDDVNKEYVYSQKVVENTISIKDIIYYVWLCGLVVVSMIFIVSNLVFKLKLKQQIENSIESKRYTKLLKESKLLTDTKKNISIIISEEINTPCLIGVVKPIIILPRFINDFTDSQIKYILLHEITHYKRKDIILNYILLTIQAFHWFNPIIWYSFKIIRQDIERAVDEKVLSTINEEEYKEYGNTIISIAESLKAYQLNPSIIQLVDDKKSIKKRIEVVRNMKFIRDKKILLSIIGILCITIMSVLLLTSKTTGREDQNLIENIYSHKSEYIGDNSNAINLINKLPLAEYIQKGIEINTKYEPMGIKIYYNIPNDTDNNEIDKNTIEKELIFNSSLIISLIQNLAYVEYDISFEDEGYTVEYNEESINDMLHADVKLYSKDINTFTKLYTYLENQKKGDSNLEDAISKAILNTEMNYGGGELATEGHVILDSKVDNELTTVYLVINASQFGFENDKFTKLTGIGGVPVKMVFKQDSDGKYRYIEREVPDDGGMLEPSIKKIFPKELWEDAINSHLYHEILQEQEIQQAKKYLEDINKDAEIVEYVEKENLSISDKAQEYLLENEDISKYPYWIGSTEEIIDDTRYRYETHQDKKEGFDIIIYEKSKLKEKKEGQTTQIYEIIETYNFKVINDKVELISHEHI